MFLTLFLLSFFMSSISYAQESSAKESQNEQIAQIVDTDLVVLKKKEKMVRLSALLYNENLIELRQLEDAFCTKYKLNLEQWKQGNYIWDRENLRFSLKKQPETEQKKN